MLRPEGKIHDRGQEKIACKDGDAIPPEAVDGGPVASDSCAIHDVVMKKRSVVEGLYKGRSFCKVRRCVVEQSGGQAEEVRTKALPLGLKEKADDRVQPMAGGMDSVKNLSRAQSRRGHRIGGFCVLLFGKHRRSLFPSCCCFRFAKGSAQEGCQQDETAYIA